jgi:hypothetical protein
MIPSLIAFSGKARNGKTEGARAIQTLHPNFTILSFATPLKRMAMDQFGLTLDDIENKERVVDLGRSQTTVRQLLIDIGKMYRAIDPDFWVKKLWKDVEASVIHGHDHIVIDDMRFMNEAIFLKEHGAKLIRVSRPGMKLIDDISETELDDYQHFDARLLNDGSIEDYHSNVAIAIGTL